MPGLYQLPVADLLGLLGDAARPKHRPAELAYESMLTRLRYLQEVGLGYLTLDRQSKTLSGGEVERVNTPAASGPPSSTPSSSWTSPAWDCIRATSTG